MTVRADARRAAPRRWAGAVLLAPLLLALGGCAWLRVASGPAWSPPPLPLGEPPRFADLRDRSELRFLVFGDSGTGREEQRRVAHGMARACRAAGGCDFALVLGDNIYPSGVAPSGRRDGRTAFDRQFDLKFEEPYRELGRLDFWLVPGNHDWYRKGSVAAEVAYTAHSERWRMPATDYAVPGLPDWIRIHGLDTTPLVKGRALQQLDRARNGMCGAPGWRLLFGHHPVYASGPHADRRGVFPRALERLAPLLEECRVQLYLAGHEHHQEHLSAPAFEQVVQGAAAKLRRVRRKERRPDGVQSLAAASRLGFALLHATPDRLEIRFHDAGGEPFYCRVIDRERFDGPRRSRPCTEGDAGEPSRPHATEPAGGAPRRESG